VFPITLVIFREINFSVKNTKLKLLKTNVAIWFNSTPTIDEPHGVISIKHRIYSLKMDHRIRNM
jgi:hypothetical protein